MNWKLRGAIKMKDHPSLNAGMRNRSRRQSHMIPVPLRWSPGALNIYLTRERIFKQHGTIPRIYRNALGVFEKDHSLRPLFHSLPLGNVDSFTPAHLAPEGLPSALSRAATLAAWVPFGPTFGCSFSKTPQPFRLCALWSILLNSSLTHMTSEGTPSSRVRSLCTIQRPYWDTSLQSSRHRIDPNGERSFGREVAV